MTRFTTRNLSSLGNPLTIPLAPDEEGYIGRECPVKDCLGYFKITSGTGLKGPAPSHCPYCGHRDESKKFTTPAQIEFAKSVATRQITDAWHKDLKSLEFDHRPRGAFGIGMSLKVQSGSRRPIKHYREKELETTVVCDQCTLRYLIYGVFAWCPDCGAHNSLQILNKTLDLAGKELLLAQAQETDLAEYLIGDGLKNVISSFDGFGRALCEERGAKISFQNLTGARRREQEAFSIDFADGLTEDDWEQGCRLF